MLCNIDACMAFKVGVTETKSIYQCYFEIRIITHNNDEPIVIIFKMTNFS